MAVGISQFYGDNMISIYICNIKKSPKLTHCMVHCKSTTHFFVIFILTFVVCGEQFGLNSNTVGRSTYYNDVTMSAIASQITSLAIIYLTLYSGADQRKHQSSASLAFVRGIHRWPVNSPHKGPVPRDMFPFDDVIMWPPWLIRPPWLIGLAYIFRIREAS